MKGRKAKVEVGSRNAECGMLKPEVADKYDMLKGHGVGEYRVYPHGIVHLDRIDLAKADKLVAGGFGYLVLKRGSRNAECGMLKSLI